jgi:hypothetical protein
VKNATKGAKLDKITEKRQFPIDFFCKTFNYSILPIYQQIAIIKNGIYWKKMAKKLNSPLTYGEDSQIHHLVQQILRFNNSSTCKKLNHEKYCRIGFSATIFSRMDKK